MFSEQRQVRVTEEWVLNKVFFRARLKPSHNIHKHFSASFWGISFVFFCFLTALRVATILKHASVPAPAYVPPETGDLWGDSLHGGSSGSPEGCWLFACR